ncbi:ATP-binding cassette domain-containing protein [Rubellimicrobium sp. CFH 75288]|uniref:ABC transporter ATP-binding protein n=1 Tax=Rubellimicrobium sp. CFH 75288 TaxID=2697034 RepID=UPI0014128E0B|nr:ATP-binding cassette domain-containing protein [Rubellimicrobium sp. CFH 75288]
MSAAALAVRGLSVAYGTAVVVRDLSFDLQPGEVLALVGLSGCGKTTVLRALLGLLPPSARVDGRLRAAGEDLAPNDRTALRRRLGHAIGFVAQNPFDACAPHRSVRAHIEEAWRALGHRPDPARIAALCDRLGLDPAMLDRFPHEWSGGMLQRANIAAALALDPPVVLADEPTSAVDADNAKAVMACLRDGGRSVLVVSHDLDLMARTANRILLLENGRIAAETPAGQAYAETAPGPIRTFARAAALVRPPEPSAAPPLLECQDLVLVRGARPLFPPLSLRLRPGEVLGVVGPSGSGKSSLLAALAGRLPPAAGLILRDGAERPPRRGEVLTLFQNALSSMNPRWPIERVVAEPLTVGPVRLARAARAAAARAMLARQGLAEVDPGRRPWQLSTGQTQRVTLARAALARPRLLLADEPTSALDPRQRCLAIEGLARIAAAGSAVVLVSHDRGMLDRVCHRVVTLDPCSTMRP